MCVCATTTHLVSGFEVQFVRMARLEVVEYDVQIVWQQTMGLGFLVRKGVYIFIESMSEVFIFVSHRAKLISFGKCNARKNTSRKRYRAMNARI